MLRKLRRNNPRIMKKVKIVAMILKGKKMPRTKLTPMARKRRKRRRRKIRRKPKLRHPSNPSSQRSNSFHPKS